MSVFYLFNSILLLHTIKNPLFYCDTKHIVGGIDPAWVMNSSEFSVSYRKKEEEDKEEEEEEEGGRAEGGRQFWPKQKRRNILVKWGGRLQVPLQLSECLFFCLFCFLGFAEQLFIILLFLHVKYTNRQ